MAKAPCAWEPERMGGGGAKFLVRRGRGLVGGIEVAEKGDGLVANHPR